MKKLLYILLITIIGVSSCSKKEDVFKSKNSSPLISFKGEYATEYSKSDIDSVKISQMYYILSYKIEDEENNNLSIHTDLRYELSQEYQSGNIKFALDETGEYEIGISYTDSWGYKDNLEYKLVIFNNIPPICILELEEISKYEWNIDASKSYDQDANFQGKIALYRFYVNRKEIDKTYHSSIKYIFPESGTYEVGVQIQDNDNTWSDIKYQTIKIED